MPSFGPRSSTPGAKPVASQCPPVMLIRLRDGTTRGPTTVPRATPLPSATVTSPPKSRTVVNPARTVFNALAAATNAWSASVRVTGSMKEVAEISLPRWVWRSMKPGSRVTSPRSTVRAPAGTVAGLTAVIRSPWTTTAALVSIRPLVTSSIRAARITMGWASWARSAAGEPRARAYPISRRIVVLPSWPRRHLGDEDVGLGRSDREIELPPIGREAVLGVLPVGIVEGDQDGAGAAGAADRLDHPAGRRALQVVELRSVRRPRRVVRLGAVGGPGHDQRLRPGGDVAHPEAVETVIDELPSGGRPAREVAARGGDELAGAVRQVHDGEPVARPAEDLEQDRAAVGRPVGIELLIRRGRPAAEPGPVGLHRVDVAASAPEGMEGDPLAVGRPVAAEVAGRIGGDLARLAARRGHHVEVGVAAPVRVEDQPASVGRHIHALDGLVAGGDAGRPADRDRPARGHRNGPDGVPGAQAGIGQPAAPPAHAQPVGIGAGGEPHGNAGHCAPRAQILPVDVPAAVAVRHPEELAAVPGPLGRHVERADR